MKFIQISRITWLSRFKDKHQNAEFKYNLPEIMYSDTKIRIFHVKCGKYFEKTPGEHWRGAGCNNPECLGIKKWQNRRPTKKQIETAFRKIHGKKYIYPSEYISDRDKEYVITCPIYGHGDFKMTPKDHKRGLGCRKCASIKRSNDSKHPIKKSYK